MASGAVGAVGRQLGRVFGTGAVAGLNEGQLLDRFVTRQDDAAFEALVARHGPMVHSVCRRLLRDPNDVDDAFQATFLVLARKAGSLRRRDLLGNWLYGVALKVATRARCQARRRHANESPTPGVDALALAPARAEVDLDAALGPNPALHEELRRLPEKYRSPVVLCYLEGLTHEEAADRLRWPVGTVKGRLARARDLLRSRLTRRGISLATALAAVDLLATEAPAAVPDRLVVPTVRAAARFAADPAAAGVGVASAQASVLAQGVIHAMSLTQSKAALGILALAGTLATGAGAFAFQFQGREPGKPDAPAKKSAPAEPRVKPGADSAPPKPPAGSPRSAAIEALLDEAKKGFNVLLGVIAKDPKALEATALSAAGASRSIRDSMAALEPENRIAAFESHVDRMKRLVDVANEAPSLREKQATKESIALAHVKAVDELNAAQRGGAPARPSSSQPQPSPGALGAGSNPSGMAGTSPPVGRARPARPVAGAGLGGAAMDGGSARDNDNVIRINIARMASRVAEEDGSPQTKKVLTKLDQSISMNFADDTPLEDVLRYIRSASQGPADSGLAIYVDPIGLQETERTLTSPVRIDLEGVPLKTTLRLLLKQLGLAYCVKDGLLIISSVKGIEQELAEALGGDETSFGRGMMGPGMGSAPGAAGGGMR